MKYFALLLSLLASFFIWQACDKIDSPYVTPTGGGIVDTVTEVKKVILIEEFTGQFCPNCPEMAASIKIIKESFGDQIVVTAIHAGGFAVPTGSTFTADYRTPAGNELDEFFDIGSAGYPKGLVNRSGYDTDTYRLGTDELAGRIVSMLEGDPVMGIKIKPSYSEGSRIVTIEVDINILVQLQNSLLLSVFITEDSIVSPQRNTNSAHGPTPIIVDYTHRHMLRASLNGTWGDPLSDGSALDPGTTFKQNYQATLSANWNDENCNIVAFVYDGDTYEVLQAAEVKIR